MTRAALTVLLLTLTLAALAEDVSGKWRAEQEADRGVKLVQLFDLKVDGEKLGGTLSLSCIPGKNGRCPPAADPAGVPLEKGTTDGKRLSFAVTLHAPNGDAVKWVYHGELQRPGELKLRREVEGEPGAQEVIAHRIP